MGTSDRYYSCHTDGHPKGHFIVMLTKRHRDTHIAILYIYEVEKN